VIRIRVHEKRMKIDQQRERLSPIELDMRIYSLAQNRHARKLDFKTTRTTFK
jgi:hypothetical protein